VRRSVAALAVPILATALLTADATARLHRLHRPPPNLPHSLTVDEREWVVQPSETVVGSGLVRFQGYNRGMDDHDMQLIGPNGVIATVYMTPGSSGSITANLRPGHYQLICSLFEGTPESHYARGMHAWITVR
jgi:uncharacterized cupredoxin-like copper-binding protein